MDEIVVGTYEGYLLGYSLRAEETDHKLKQTFATHSHTGSIRCLSVSQKFLASGGTDDKVVIIDMKTRKEHTVLMNHDGTVNAAVFTHNGSHVLTGSDDGSIIVTRTGNWQVEKMWKKAHGGRPVTAIAIHPSDKLALSIGGDKTLRTWNLIKGRPAFTVNLSSKGLTLPTDVTFSPGGDRFSLVSEQTVDIWTISKAGVEKRISCNSKPASVQWSSDDRLFVGLDNGNIITLTVSNTKALTYKAHKQRVKSLLYENDTLYSASSSGELKVWSVIDSKLNEICCSNAGCRITCVTLNRQNHLIKKEEQGESDDANDNVEEKDDEVVDNEVSDVEAVTTTIKGKPGAFVTISYDNEDKDDISEPPKKKSKKKKQSKNRTKGKK